jgi:hypothetical protein
VPGLWLSSSEFGAVQGTVTVGAPAARVAGCGGAGEVRVESHAEHHRVHLGAVELVGVSDKPGQAAEDLQGQEAEN